MCDDRPLLPFVSIYLFFRHGNGSEEWYTGTMVAAITTTTCFAQRNIYPIVVLSCVCRMVALRC
jgi:hypothetical protein